MNFFLIMATLCIFLDVNAETRLKNCTTFRKYKDVKKVIFTYGLVCTKSACNWLADSTCKNGTYSKVLKWETDIFEIGFDQIVRIRPREIGVKIDLNEAYYVDIKVISDKENRTVKVILNECSHKEKTCLEITNNTESNLNITDDNTFVAIGFRKDKKINFAAVSKNIDRATDLFGKENEYEFKLPGFYFNTSETMNITVYSKFDKNYKYDGLAMFLPTSVGGMLFNEKGYLVRDDFRCFAYYFNPDEKKGLTYILREYFNNSENWRANVVEYTLDATVPYFDENGMKVKSQEEMKVKEEKNPNFDAEKMIRKGCRYLGKPNIDTEPDSNFTETNTTTRTESTLTGNETKETTTTRTKESALTEDENKGKTTTTESTLTEDETAETTTATLNEDDVTETTKSDDSKKKSLSTSMPPPLVKKNEQKDSYANGEIRINNEVLIPNPDSTEDKINLFDLFERVGNGSFNPNYLKNVGKGGDDYNVTLANGTHVDLKGYKFKNPKKKGEKKKDTKKKEGGSGGSKGSGGSGGSKRSKGVGGSGGAGDASRGQKQLKIISPKYFVILILMILSV